MMLREDVEAGMRVERALWQTKMMALCEQLRAQGHDVAARKLAQLTSTLANPT